MKKNRAGMSKTFKYDLYTTIRQIKKIPI